jgi:hypothetical protein
VTPPHLTPEQRRATILRFFERFLQLAKENPALPVPYTVMFNVNAELVEAAFYDWASVTLAEVQKWCELFDLTLVEQQKDVWSTGFDQPIRISYMCRQTGGGER